MAKFMKCPRTVCGYVWKPRKTKGDVKSCPRCKGYLKVEGGKQNNGRRS